MLNSQVHQPNKYVINVQPVAQSVEEQQIALFVNPNTCSKKEPVYQTAGTAILIGQIF